MNIDNSLTGETFSTPAGENYSSASGAPLQRGGISMRFKNELDKLISNFSAQKTLNKDDEINKLFLDLDFGSQNKLETVKIGQEDAIFFVNLLNQNGLINYQVAGDNIELTTKNSNQMQVSSAMMDMLKSSYDTKKPIRMDFDNNVTVILKLDDKGKVNAHFIPGDKAVEEYLRNNIPYLRQRFDEQNIPYTQISYKQQKEQNQNQKNKKENEQ